MHCTVPHPLSLHCTIGSSNALSDALRRDIAESRKAVSDMKTQDRMSEASLSGSFDELPLYRSSAPYRQKHAPSDTSCSTSSSSSSAVRASLLSSTSSTPSADYERGRGGLKGLVSGLGAWGNAEAGERLGGLKQISLRNAPMKRASRKKEDIDRVEERWVCDEVEEDDDDDDMIEELRQERARSLVSATLLEDEAERREAERREEKRAASRWEVKAGMTDVMQNRSNYDKESERERDRERERESEREREKESERDREREREREDGVSSITKQNQDQLHAEDKFTGHISSIRFQLTSDLLISDATRAVMTAQYDSSVDSDSGILKDALALAVRTGSAVRTGVRQGSESSQVSHDPSSVSPQAHSVCVCTCVSMFYVHGTCVCLCLCACACVCVYGLRLFVFVCVRVCVWFV
jgi:hypothetical protein